ncbi:antitoxin Xre/MbcA/ParS toxin-binding domain-containing protein [Vreelandella aquamarina]|uniref:antitoxin Xre/MbcA/ParS toxin-binding domain-containing protein n=1 Tax=Vreelandella aquamarina TaxID=77097 RepID=UPI00384D260F
MEPAIQVGFERDIKAQAAALLGASESASLDALIRQGIHLSAIDRVAAYGVNAVELGIISKAALKRRLSQGKTLTLCEGDKLYRAILATLFAETIFGNPHKSYIWLLKPRKALGGQNALQATATTPGYNAVVTLLERLRHGFAA